MPIAIKCQCGKALKVKDELAGKAVKCPGCGQPVRVGQPGVPQKQQQAQAQAPAAQSATQSAAQPAAMAAPAAAQAGAMDELFDEAGFSHNVAAVCPSCRAEMDANAVFCTKCGYHKETGESIERHKTAGLDIDAGTLALDKATADLEHADKVQREMEAKSGMPWWMLSLVILMLASGTTIAVLAVNATNQVDAEISFTPMVLFLNLVAGAFGLVAFGAIVKIGVMYAKGEAEKKKVIKLGIGIVVLAAVAIGCLIAASNQ